MLSPSWIACSRASSVDPSSCTRLSGPADPDLQDFCIWQTDGKAEITTSMSYTLPISKLLSGLITHPLPLLQSKCVQLLLQQVLAGDGHDTSASQPSCQDMRKCTSSPSTGSDVGTRACHPGGLVPAVCWMLTKGVWWPYSHIFPANSLDQPTPSFPEFLQTHCFLLPSQVFLASTATAFPSAISSALAPLTSGFPKPSSYLPSCFPASRQLLSCLQLLSPSAHLRTEYSYCSLF